MPLPAPPQRAFALYVVRAALGWAAYGLGFWLFARALFGDDAPHLWLAATSYVGSYLLGLIAVFAPGGLVVREGALVVTLQPAIGPERALVLAIASRMWLVSLEIIGAATVVGADWVIRRSGLPHHEDELVAERRHQSEHAESEAQRDTSRSPVLEDGWARVSAHAQHLQACAGDQPAPPCLGVAMLNGLRGPDVEIGNDRHRDRSGAHHAREFPESGRDVGEMLH